MDHTTVKINKLDLVKSILEDEHIVCRHRTGFDLRKQIHVLKVKHNYIIYSERCNCNTVQRKHIGYSKDWAIQ
tara:strand:+ start:162 stop:380 length:219 start_codon:yes stop_codon:yes gene_type:complete